MRRAEGVLSGGRVCCRQRECCWACCRACCRACGGMSQARLLRLHFLIDLRGEVRDWHRARRLRMLVGLLIVRSWCGLKVHHVLWQVVVHFPGWRKAGTTLRHICTKPFSRSRIRGLFLHVATFTARAYASSARLSRRHSAGWAATHPQHRTSCGSWLARGARLQFEPPSAM